MSSPFQNSDPRCVSPEACNRHGLAAHLCQPCHFRARRAAAGYKPELLPPQTLRYVSQFGGFCRDCADNRGVCPNSGLPCDDRLKAIKWVIDAINYGAEHGFLKVASQQHSAQGE